MPIEKNQEFKSKINLISIHNFKNYFLAIVLFPLVWITISNAYQGIQQDNINKMRQQSYLIERGAEDDAEDLALSQNQVVNYVRCFQRSSGNVTCIVHTPPADIRATCLARTNSQILVDGTRCRWDNPSSMAHP